MAYTPIAGFFQSGAVQSTPDLSTLSSTGYPTSGDPTKGIAATVPGAAWFYLIDQLRLSLIAAAGKTPSVPPTEDEFLTALQSFGWAGDGTLDAKVLTDKSIATAKLANLLVTAEKLATDAVVTEKVKDLAITAAKLAADAVVTAKIQDKAVTFAKLADGAIATAAQAQAGTATDVLLTPAVIGGYVQKYACPTGSLLHYLGTSVPSGWLLCNGSAVSRTTYSALFSVLGTKCGSGDGSTTFNLPNLHHRFLEGTTSTGEVGNSVAAGLPGITGAIDIGKWGSGIGISSSGAAGCLYSRYTNANTDRNGTDAGTGMNQGIALSAAKSSSIYGTASTVQPVSLRVLPIIKI